MYKENAIFFIHLYKYNKMFAMNPDQNSSQLEDWDSKQYQQWKEIVGKFNEDDPRKLEAGHWTVSFAISPFPSASLSKLNDVLRCDMPKYTGWPPFAYLQESKQPFPENDCIRAHPGELTGGETPYLIIWQCGYWVICQTGNGFMLRPMEEDFEPYPEGRYFDWVLPIWRVTEILLFIKKFAEMFNATGSKFKLLLKYKNTKGRKLVRSSHGYNLSTSTGPECHSSSLETAIEEAISEIDSNLDEFVWKTLVPVFEQFEFTKLPREVVSNEVSSCRRIVL